MKKTGKAFDQVLDKIVNNHEQRRKEKKDPHVDKDFVDILLSLMHQPIDTQNAEQSQLIIDRTNIKSILMDNRLIFNHN